MCVCHQSKQFKQDIMSTLFSENLLIERGYKIGHQQKYRKIYLMHSVNCKNRQNKLSQHCKKLTVLE